ncbi:hypothetical protein B0H10DRAFT_2217720 [Mycena sp. CBHHK59/15]|nr:hypothetical protein B0H10DRAFT_2217720 [Mycena sp. CBHHK59/15]
MAKRAAATSEKALKAAAVAAAEAKLKDGEKPPKRPRGRPKKPTPVSEPVTEEPLPDAKAALAQSIQEAKNIVIECIGSAPRCFSTLTCHDGWDFDLTWTLINTIEEDEEIQDGLFPGIGAIKRNADDEPSVKKPDTKSNVDTSDPSRDPASEDEDDRTGGRKIDPLLLEVSKAWKTSDGDRKVRCLASAGCNTTWKWPRSRQRVLKHAMTCGHLAAANPLLVQRVIEELAKEDPSLLGRLTDKFGLTSKRPRDDPEPGSSAPIDVPPLKRAKVSASTVTQESAPQPAKAVNSTGSTQQGQLAQYQTEGRKILAQKVNNALVELFVCCGISPRIIGREEFKNLVNTLNPNYNLVSRTKFEDSLIPAYAATVRVAVTQYLQTCRFLTISADGGKLTKKKFVSVHITTVHRQSFCVDLDDVSRLSQTGEYFDELFTKVNIFVYFGTAH